MTRREQWRPVLQAEMKRWSAMSYEQLRAELAEGLAYEVEFESKKYQVEVELLESTENYLNVAVAVDDGSLPASICPLTSNFLRAKEASAREE